MPRSVDVDRQEFARLWAENVPAYRIAHHFDIHANTVTRIVCEMKLPPREREVDVPLLFRLWNESSLTRAEVARQLGVTANQLTKLAAQYGLAKRGKQHRAFSMDDPTPEEIAQRAAECRERHMAQRRAEDVCNTYSKVSKWRAGICNPS